MRGVAYALGASESAAGRRARAARRIEEVKADKHKFARATKIIHQETNPLNAKTLVQYHDRQAVVCNPPRLADQPGGHGPRLRPALHAQAAPDVQGEPIPAFETVKDSVTIMRGCFGGCTFCSITAHQGRIIQSRSQESVLTELRPMGADPEFSGVVSDIGGPDGQHVPDALHAARGRGEVQAAVVRPPQDLQAAGDRPRPARRADAARAARCRASTRCFVASGVRMDLAQKSPEYMDELAAHHVGGHLKVAPEHTDPDVLERDEEARDQRLRGLRRGLQGGQRRGGQEAVPGALLHRVAPRQRPERDDRPGRCS